RGGHGSWPSSLPSLPSRPKARTLNHLNRREAVSAAFWEQIHRFTEKVGFVQSTAVSAVAPGTDRPGAVLAPEGEGPPGLVPLLLRTSSQSVASPVPVRRWLLYAKRRG